MSFPNIYVETGEGGILSGGEHQQSLAFGPVASGGVSITQPPFANGHHYKTTITVPAGRVAQDLPFYLLVRLAVPDVSGSFLVTDANGHTLAHDVRQIDEVESHVVLVFKCWLSASVDNVFYVYSGGA